MTNLNRLIEMDHEVGRANQPPKLLHVEDYYRWRERFESFARFHDIKMWICIDEGYTHPTEEVDGRSKQYPYWRMKEEDKRMYEAENKALSCIKMCLPQEILHTFRNYRSSKELWDTIEKRFDGNAQVKKGKGELLKKQFALFNHMKGESLNDVITRFYHLMAELEGHDIAYTETELKDKLLDSLPSKWETQVMLIKNDEKSYEAMKLEDMIDRLRVYSFDKQKKEMVTDQAQDPGVYFGKPSNSGTTGSSNTSAFFSGGSEQVNFMDAEGNCFVSSTSSNDKVENSASIKSTQIHKKMPMSVKSAEEQLGVLASFVASYENYINGKIHDPALADEDFDQLDADDLEEMDLQWQLAMLSRRVKKFISKTGRKMVGGKPGFDKSKVRCYNCQGLGHFARECQQPKSDQGRHNSSGSSRNSQSLGNSLSSNALIVKQLDGSYDWSGLSEDAEKPAQAFMAEVTEANKAEEGNQQETAEQDSGVLQMESTGSLSTEDFAALMGNVSTDKPKVCVDLSSVLNICHEFLTLKESFDLLTMSSNSMSVQMESLKLENASLKETKSDLVTKIKADAQDIIKLKDAVNEQGLKTDILYERIQDLTKEVANREKELADAKVKNSELSRKFEQFRTSSLTLNTIISSQRGAKDNSGVGYNDVPPPFNANYSKTPKFDETNDNVAPSDSSTNWADLCEAEKDQISVPDNVSKNPTVLKKPVVDYTKQVKFTLAEVIGGESSDGPSNESVRTEKVETNINKKGIDSEVSQTPSPQVSKGFKKKKPMHKLSCFICHEVGHVASCCPSKTPNVTSKQIKRDKTPIKIGNSNGASASTSTSTGPRVGFNVENAPMFQRNQHRFQPVTQQNTAQPRSITPGRSVPNQLGDRSKTPQRFHTPGRTRSGPPNQNHGDNFQWVSYNRTPLNYNNQRSRVPMNSGSQHQKQPKPILKGSKSPERRDGTLTEFTFIDDNGKPKTVMAWVPHNN